MKRAACAALSFFSFDQPSWSRKLLSRSDLDGWRSLRSALASICRMRSRVTSNCLPTSSRVWSVDISMPKRMRSTLASRGVSVSSTSFVTSRRLAKVAASEGASVDWSSMKSPRCESSSSPIGVSIEIGSLEILRILRIFSSGISMRAARVAGSGSWPVSCRIWRLMRFILLMVSIMCTGMRMVRAWLAITRSIADQARTIRIPVHMIETINKMNRISRQILQETGQEPDPATLAARMEMPEEKIRKILKISKEPISMETPIGDDDDSHLGDFIEDQSTLAPSDAATFASLRDVTKEVLDTLTPREAKVLRMRFGIEMSTDHTLEEVGKQFDVTRERIRQIEAKALRKLRHPSRSERLKSFLDQEG